LGFKNSSKLELGFRNLRKLRVNAATMVFCGKEEDEVRVRSHAATTVCRAFLEQI